MTRYEIDAILNEIPPRVALAEFVLIAACVYSLLPRPDATEILCERAGLCEALFGREDRMREFLECECACSPKIDNAAYVLTEISGSFAGGKL